ncbi:hypothetical protein A3850_019060 [Lewinella sp. 4G2]|nr:hypothetical protein A3850_019060 [Lewinella sp. 4G2]
MYSTLTEGNGYARFANGFSFVVNITLMNFYTPPPRNGIISYSMKPNKSAEGVLRMDARNYGLKSGMYQLRLITSLNEVFLEKLIIEL